MAIGNLPADSPFYLWPDVRFGDLQTEDSMVIHDTECPYQDQVSISNTKTPYQGSDDSTFFHFIAYKLVLHFALSFLFF